MRIKQFALKSVIVLLALVMCLCFFPSINIFAEGTSTPKVCASDFGSATPTDDILRLPYPANAETGTPIELYIDNGNFKEYITQGKTVKVSYSYIKDGGDTFVYTDLTETVSLSTIDEYDKNKKANVSFNPFLVGGVGTYFIRANVFIEDNTTHIKTVLPINNFFTVKILDPVAGNYDVTIHRIKNPVGTGELDSYSLEVEVALNSKPIDVKHSNITWTVTHEDLGKKLCGKGYKIDWNPKLEGHYIMRVDIAELPKYAELDFDIEYNYSTYLIIGAIALAVVMLGIVITVTVMKVKKERVW